MWAVETAGLSKNYGRTASLVNCDLQIPEGCIFGLLGPNGAGKTTLLRTLLGFLAPSAGTASLGGYDIARQGLLARRYVSYLPGEARLYRTLRGRDLVHMFSGLHPCGSHDQARAVAERLDLDLSRRVMFMSTGMRQKLAIAIVLGCQAPLLVLDEPTANLDSNVRGEVIELVQQARAQGRTLLFSSHIFSDIDAACDRVAIMRSGHIVAEQQLNPLEQLHIVTGGLNSDSHAELVERAISESDFVEFSRVSSGCDESKIIQLHLSGSPNRWLTWLSTLDLKHPQIEKAGVRAVYERHHPLSPSHPTEVIAPNDAAFAQKIRP